MKKKMSPLRFERETIRNLTPDHLDAAVGGAPGPDNRFFETYYNSCTNPGGDK